MTIVYKNSPPYHKILLVDDEIEILNLLEAALGDYEVLLAKNCATALDLARQNQIFLVVSDYRLPDGDGVELCQKIKQNSPDRTIKSYLITGYGDKSVVADALNEGFNAYYDKPIDTDRLIERTHADFETHKREIDEERIMIKTYFEEADEFCDELELLLRDLPHVPENLRQVKRILHTLKGNSGLFSDFKQVEQLCHHTEDILPKNLDVKDDVPVELIKALILACDELKSLLQHLRDDRRYRANMPELMQKIAVTTTAVLGVAAPTSGGKKPTTTLPAFAAPEGKTDSAKKDGIYVPTTTLDQFMRSIGELISVRNFLENVLYDPQTTADPKLYHQRISEIYGQLGVLCNGLHTGLMEIRKVPIKHMFKPYFRIVRNLATRTEKNVEFVVNDHDTMVDTNIVKQLGDALIHLIKNSVDHGIEMPAERIKQGKPEHGTIKIEITQDRTDTYMTISDDGRGLMRDKIVAKALKVGLISVDAAATMRDEDVYALILLPGFSTAETVNELSGRGIGLDAVKKAVDDLGGRLTLKSTPDKGTSMTLTIPQVKTININRMMVYRIKNQFFASKLQDIKFITSLERSTIQKYDSEQSFIEHGGEIINIANWKPAQAIECHDSAAEQTTNQIVVIFHRGKEAIGLLVDELLDIGQLVVNELQEPLDITGFSGKTILKTGKPSLIITPRDLFH